MMICDDSGLLLVLCAGYFVGIVSVKVFAER